MSDNENWVTDESFGYAAPSAPSEESDGNWLTDKAIDTAKGIANLGTTAIDLGALGLSAMANSRLRKNYEDQGLNPDDAPRVDINADLRNYGYSPTGMNQWFNSHYSKGRQAAEQEVEEAEGFTGKVKAYLTNPDVLMGRGFENLSNLAGLAGISRMAAKAALKEGTAMGLTGDALEKYIQRRATTASAVGEGGLSAAGVSQAIGEDNLENGKGYSENQHYALGAGAAVGLFSPLSNMEARMGAKGILNSIVKREAISTGEPVSLLKTIGGKVGSLGKDITKEGAIEEGGQNVAEGIFTRLGQGKPWHEGIGEDYGEGLVIGGAMGAAMHSFAGKPKGTVEQAINNSSSQQAAEEVAARPKTELNPEEQSQIAQAAADAQNPVEQAAEQPVETQQPQMSPEEAELARMNAEDAARRQAVIDKYGLEFNREHGAAFADVTRNITDEAEKDFHAKILQAAGMMGIKNPFKEKEAAANFATEYKTFGGDLAKLAEFYRNIGIKAENDAGKKQGALRQAEFYQQLADLLEGGELLNFEQRRARKEEKKAAQAAATQAAQVQQTAEQMKAQEPAPVEAQPEVKTQPKPTAEAPKFSGVIPSEEEMSDMQYDKTRQYRGEVAAVMSRLEKEGKITPEQKEKVFGLFNRNPRKHKVIDNYKAAMHALKDIENPQPPKEAKSTRKTLTKEAEETWLVQGKLTPEARQILGYTDAEADQLENINKLFTTKEVPAHAKQVNKLNSLIMHGDSRGAKQLAELMTKRAEALHVKEYIESEEMQGSDVDKFNSLVAEERYQEALTMAYKPFSEGGLELSREEINSIDPSRLKKEGEAINKGTEEEGEGQSAGEDLEKSEENSNEGSVEDTGRVEAEQNGESGSDTIGVAARVKGGTEKAGRAMAAKHSKTVAKKEEDRSKGTVKVTKGEDVKEKLEVIPPKDRSSKVDFSKKLEDADKSRTEEMKAAEEADKAAAKAEAKNPEPVVVNATIPESPFEKKEEAPKKTKFGDALKKAFDDAKAGEKSKPLEVKATFPELPEIFSAKRDPQAEMERRFREEAAQEEKNEIITAMERYVDGKRTRGVGKARIAKIKELDKKGLLTKEERKIAADYVVKHAADLEAKVKKPDPKIKASRKRWYRNPLVETVKEAEDLVGDFVEYTLSKDRSDRSRIEQLDYLAPNERTVTYVKDKLGIDVSRYVHSISATSITHAYDNHVTDDRAMDKSELFEEDFKRIPDVVQNFDSIELLQEKKKGRSLEKIAYTKRFDDGTVLVVEEVRTGQARLSFVSARRVTDGDKGSTILRENGLAAKELASENAPIPASQNPSDKAIVRDLGEKAKRLNYGKVFGALIKAWGAPVIRALEGSHRLVICRSNREFIDRIAESEAKKTGKSVEEVRQELIKDGYHEGTNGVYNEHDGKVYINAEVASAEDAAGILAHEVAVHAAKDSEFKELIEDCENRIKALMEKGLKSKRPAEREFWRKVQERMENAGETSNEERLAYFLQTFIEREGVTPQTLKSEIFEVLGKLKEWLLNFVGINTLNERQVANILQDVLRAYAKEELKTGKNGLHASKAIVGTRERADGSKVSQTYYVSTESGKTEPDLAHFAGFKGVTKEGFSANYPAGPIRMTEGHLKIQDTASGHLSGTGLLHRVNNALHDKGRMPSNYVQGDLTENVMRELQRNLMGGAQAVYAVTGNQVMVKTKGGLGVLLAWKSWNPQEEGGDGFWSVQTVYSKRMMSEQALRRNEWKGVLRTRGGTAGVQHVISQTTHRTSNSAPARTAPSLIRPTDDRLSAARSSLETFSEPEEVNDTTIQEKIKAENERIDEEIKPYLHASKEKRRQEKLAKMTPSQRASYERQQKRAELNRKIKKQQDERVGKAEMEKTEAAKNEAKAVETGGFKKLIEDTFTGKAAPIGDAILWVGEVGAKLNNKLFKFTDRLVDELSKFAPSAKGYYQKLIDHAKARAEYQAKSAAIYEGWQKLDEKNRKAVNQFLFDSTSSGLWGYIPADWTDMDGKAVPEETFGQVDAHMAKLFEALSPEAQAVVQQVFKYGHDTMILKQKLYDLMGQALQGKNYVSPFKSPKSVLPYSPLRRTGTYNVVWVSPELKEARGKLKALQDKYTSLKENDKDEEQAATRNAKLGVSHAKEAVDKLERSADHYYVGRFEYFTDARQAVRDLKAEHPGNDAVMYEIGTEEGLKSLTSTAEVNEMTANLITAVEKNYGPVSKAMKQSILEMTMDAAQKKVDASMRKRRNIAGANPNMMDSFLHQGQTDSWLLSNMRYGKQISDAFQKVKTEAKDYREGPEEGKATVGDMQALYNELQARHQRMMERHNHNAWDTFSEWARTSNTALTLSFKPMFYVQNALQPWMMTAPWLAGQFGGYKTQTTMAKAYGEWGTMFNAAMKDAKTASEKFHAFGNLSKQIEDSKLPPEEKAMLKEMMSRNLLDLGAQQEFGNVTGRSAISKAINKTMVEISVAARGVELLNRYVTAVSGFRLKKAELMGKGKTESEAVQGATEYAADLLSMTQGDYSALNAPDWFNTRPGKFMLQFRKFQAIQLNFFKQMLKNSFDKNMSREERAAARRQLTWALGTHFAMAGVKGLPAMSATLALLSSMGLLGDDDEDEETALRRHLAEAGVPVEFQDLMLEGLPSFLGWNLSDSVGAGTMLSAAPYRREDLFSKDGFREAIWSLGGAPLGRAERIWKGYFDSNWEHQRPFWEAVLPAGIPSALKAAGIFDPTEDKKTGAKMLNDGEISFGSRALMMLGATPKSVERMYKMRNQAFRTQEYIKEEKGDLTRRWIDAMKNRDYKAQSEIRKELPELNKTRRAKGFKPVSMNDLMTAWKTRQKEEKLMQKNHGLKLPNSQQGFAKQLNKIYN